MEGRNRRAETETTLVIQPAFERRRVLIVVAIKPAEHRLPEHPGLGVDRAEAFPDRCHPEVATEAEPVVVIAPLGRDEVVGLRRGDWISGAQYLALNAEAAWIPPARDQPA